MTLPTPEDRPTPASPCDERGAHAWVYSYDHGTAMHCDDCGVVLDVDDGDYIAERIDARDDIPPSPYE